MIPLFERPIVNDVRARPNLVESSSGSHDLQMHEMAVESAWIFDMDCYYQTLILAIRIFVIGGTHMLKKINLTNPNQNEDIKLPSNTKAVKDLYVSPCGKLVFLASMGKKLSITSMGCNKVVISYNLPVKVCYFLFTCLWIYLYSCSLFFFSSIFST
ncbi:uncharacterized protein LOC114296149 [Camellia sinensis]|uniref:uncharacterized protein LOC114296149 n=1 Tax=Camellia sinensis TaxID=4442 RepID=UPI0010359089|nr:uncharacterized protein LOC114296149 [Camellia sinensis]